MMGECNVCTSNEAIRVASSSLGAIAKRYCKSCLDNNAEPLDLLFFTLDMNDGPEGTAPWVKELESFKDGKYIKWDEIVAAWKDRPPVDS